MNVVGESLKQLIKQYSIVDQVNCFDNTCISLGLGKNVISIVPTNEITTLIYGDKIPDECIKTSEIGVEGIIIKPHSSILASSYETVYMPSGYMGLLQTKGSLARLMVSIHFSDGQIDSGFKGKVTFEIFNASDFSIKLFCKQKVGNLYIFKTTSNDCKPYSGRYNNATGPSIQVEDR